VNAYSFHPNAFADLNDIWEFIAQDSVMQQTAYWTKLRARSTCWSAIREQVIFGLI
jgi:plasmid stabilization system protein ParE